METTIKYPIGIQDFEGLRKDGYIYVDKTELIRKLIDTGKYYFLSRPRRFGKSLLLSTIKAYFGAPAKPCVLPNFDGKINFLTKDLEMSKKSCIFAPSKKEKYGFTVRTSQTYPPFGDIRTL